MFDIGWTELLIISVVAIIVVGPKDLPAMLRSLGRYAGKLKRTANEFRTQFDDALRDSELAELRESISDIDNLNPVNQIRDSVTESLDPLRDTVEDLKSGIEDTGADTVSGDYADVAKEMEKLDEKPAPSTAEKKPAPEKKKAAPKQARKPAANKKAAKTKSAATESEG